MTAADKPKIPSWDLDELAKYEPPDGVFCVPREWAQRQAKARAEAEGEGKPAGRKKKSLKPRSTPDWPKTVAEAVQQILSKMSKKDRQYLLDLPRERLLELHFTWGMGIRNGLGLWGGNQALLDDCAKGRGWIHPDDVSWVIMEAVWDELHKPAAPGEPDEGSGGGAA